MTKYIIEVDLPSDVPADVVSEHVGQSLKKWLANRTSVNVTAADVPVDHVVRDFLNGGTIPPASVRNHPFDGPEVFDDEEISPAVAAAGVILTKAESKYPALLELLDAKKPRPIKRGETTQPPAEGDWQLSNDSQVGED